MRGSKDTSMAEPARLFKKKKNVVGQKLTLFLGASIRVRGRLMVRGFGNSVIGPVGRAWLEGWRRSKGPDRVHVLFEDSAGG